MEGVAPPDPPLAGRRVGLRPFRLDDAKAVAAACRSADIPEFTMMPAGMTEEQARAWIEHGLDLWHRGLARFAITEPPADVCVGQIGLQLELTPRRAGAFYWLDPDARGRGLAIEALDLVTRWAFDQHGIVRVQLVTHVHNTASHRVAQGCGFRREGVLRAYELIKDEQPDVVMWSRLVTDPAPELLSSR